jgi:hypothetical protein
MTASSPSDLPNELPCRATGTREFSRLTWKDKSVKPYLLVYYKLKVSRHNQAIADVSIDTIGVLYDVITGPSHDC